MKLIESKAELLPWEPGIEGVYKAIERAGRTCYKSEDKMTEDSAKSFVDRMIASKHTAMLEHGTVYLAIPYADDATLSHHRGYAGKYNEIEFTKYSKVTMTRDMYNYVTVNFRVLQENGWLYDLKYLCDPTEYHEMRYSFKFTCSRAIANELIRHRVFSFAQESQRYCNYSKDKFDNEITCIKPSWMNINTGKIRLSAREEWKVEDVIVPDKPGYIDFIESCIHSEYCYFHILKEGCTPQQARDVLSNATKTEIVMTGFESDWRYLFDLRLFGKTGAPHPDMVDLMEKAKAEAEKNGIWDDIMSCPSKFEI